MNAKRVVEKKGSSIYPLSSTKFELFLMYKIILKSKFIFTAAAFIIIILVTNLLTTELKAQVAGAGANDWICIPGKNVGPITAITTEKQLIDLFGSKNVVKKEFHVDEGYFEVGTVVFEGTPNEILILWKDKAQNILKKPRRVIIEAKGARWKTNNGITIGTTLNELVKINGAPITLAGFDWDYEGVILDWHKGNLAGQPISVRLQRAIVIDIPGISGDGVRLTSNDERLKGLNLYVSRFEIIFK